MSSKSRCHDEESLILDVTRDNTTSYGTGDLNGGGESSCNGANDGAAAAAADDDDCDGDSDCGGRHQKRQIRHCRHRRRSSKDSVTTTITSASTTSVVTATTTEMATSISRWSRMLRLMLIIMTMACCYMGFYSVFVLMTHRNHPEGVFGGGMRKNQKNEETSSLKYDEGGGSGVVDSNRPRSANFLFGTIGDILLGWSSPKSARPTSPNPVPRSILLMLHAEAVVRRFTFCPTKTMNHQDTETHSDLCPYLSLALTLVVLQPANDYVMLDEDRPLTATGMQQSERLGSYLAEHNVAPPDWIFCSPSVRTSYTLQLVRRRWASNVPVAFENILYVLAFNDYFAFVAGLNHNFRRVLIVGHNPAILNTAKKLMRERGLEDFPTAGFLELTWDDQQFWFNIFPESGDVRTAISGDSSENGFFDSM